jgi:hypothetical protein
MNASLKMTCSVTESPFRETEGTTDLGPDLMTERVALGVVFKKKAGGTIWKGWYWVLRASELQVSKRGELPT